MYLSVSLSDYKKYLQMSLFLDEAFLIFVVSSFY